jgi:multiple sugar transport system ATP-binding protein
MTLGDRIVVLEGGHVKQIDTPMNLYERPKNTFVAAFIGSPSMNLITGGLAASTASGAHGVEFRAADGAFTMALGAQWGARLASRVGRAVILGIRPEDILILTEGSTSERVGTVRVRLDVVEPLGSEAFLSARIGAKEITARVPPRGLPVAGSEVELVFNAERLHFFDAESGETLWVE